MSREPLLPTSRTPAPGRQITAKRTVPDRHPLPNDSHDINLHKCRSGIRLPDDFNTELRPDMGWESRMDRMPYCLLVIFDGSASRSPTSFMVHLIVAKERACAPQPTLY